MTKCTGRDKPFLEGNSSGVISNIDESITTRILQNIGDLKVRESDNEVIWNKLVRSGPHFIDTLLEFQKSIELNSKDRRYIKTSFSRILGYCNLCLQERIRKQVRIVKAC